MASRAVLAGALLAGASLAAASRAGERPALPLLRSGRCRGWAGSGSQWLAVFCSGSQWLAVARSGLQWLAVVWNGSQRLAAACLQCLQWLSASPISDVPADGDLRSAQLRRWHAADPAWAELGGAWQVASMLLSWRRLQGMGGTTGARVAHRKFDGVCVACGG
jgi:hypothetical protein